MQVAWYPRWARHAPVVSPNDTTHFKLFDQSPGSPNSRRESLLNGGPKVSALPIPLRERVPGDSRLVKARTPQVSRFVSEANFTATPARMKKKMVEGGMYQCHSSAEETRYTTPAAVSPPSNTFRSPLARHVARA